MLSLRRATPRHRHCTAFRTYFYPRSPCGERPVIFVIIVHDLIFLSTLSLRRATPRRLATVDSAQVFLSTLSLRRATNLKALCAVTLPYFYPRSPCGERLGTGFATPYFRQFLSTLSLRRATMYMITN